MEYKIAHELQVEINGVQVSNNNTTRQIILGPEFEEFMSFLKKSFVRGHPTSTVTINSNLQQKNTFATGLRIINRTKPSRNLKVPVSQYYALNETEDYKALRHRIRNSMKTKGGLDKMVLLIRAHLQIGTRGEGTESRSQDTKVPFALSLHSIYEFHNFLGYLSTISGNVGFLK